MTDPAENGRDAEPTVDELAAEELTRLRAAARQVVLGDPDGLHGAMLVCATDTGIASYPYADADVDARVTSLAVLGAHIRHVADAASEASGAEMTPEEAAAWAIDAVAELEDGDGSGGAD